MGAIDYYFQGAQKRSVEETLMREFNRCVVKYAVAIHEAGHGVVATHEGYEVRSLGSWSQGDNSWSGLATLCEPLIINKSTDPMRDLQFIRILVAGFMGQAMFDAKNLHTTSDEDCEMVEARRVVRYPARKLGFDPEDLYHELLIDVACILEHNRSVVIDLAWRIELARQLDITGTLHGAPLWASLAQVRQIDLKCDQKHDLNIGESWR
jgi:hypothetical protein